MEVWVTGEGRVHEESQGHGDIGQGPESRQLEIRREGRPSDIYASVRALLQILSSPRRPRQHDTVVVTAFSAATPVLGDLINVFSRSHLRIYLSDLIFVTCVAYSHMSTLPTPHDSNFPVPFCSPLSSLTLSAELTRWLVHLLHTYSGQNVPRNNFVVFPIRADSSFHLWKKRRVPLSVAILAECPSDQVLKDSALRASRIARSRFTRMRSAVIFGANRRRGFHPRHCA